MQVTYGGLNQQGVIIAIFSFDAPFPHPHDFELVAQSFGIARQYFWNVEGDPRGFKVFLAEPQIFDFVKALLGTPGLQNAGYQVQTIWRLRAYGGLGGNAMQNLMDFMQLRTYRNHDEM